MKKLYQKLCAVIADEGMSGLLRRMIRKFFITDEESSNDEGSKVREDYERLVSDFNARALAMGCGTTQQQQQHNNPNPTQPTTTPPHPPYRKDLPRFQFRED